MFNTLISIPIPQDQSGTISKENAVTIHIRADNIIGIWNRDAYFDTETSLACYALLSTGEELTVLMTAMELGLLVDRKMSELNGDLFDNDPSVTLPTGNVPGSKPLTSIGFKQ